MDETRSNDRGPTVDKPCRDKTLDSKKMGMVMRAWTQGIEKPRDRIDVSQLWAPSPVGLVPHTVDRGVHVNGARAKVLVPPVFHAVCSSPGRPLAATRGCTRQIASSGPGYPSLPVVHLHPFPTQCALIRSPFFSATTRNTQSTLGMGARH